ncbi:MAG TPA: FtsX-like permease family protein, partial [Candidatus Elarobacter sp.]
MLFDVLVTGFLRRNALRSLLSALGVALGVAIATMFAAVASTTGDELDRTFRTIGSATNLEVIGSRTGFDQHVLVAVSRIAGVDLAAPIVEGQATIGSRDRDLVNIVGVDVLRSFPREVEIRAEVPGPFAPSGRDPAAGALLAPGAVVVSAAFARRHGLVEGSTIAVSAPRRVTLRVAGVVTRPLVGYDSNAVFADIRTAQAVLGMPNRLGRIDCVVDPAYLQQVEATARGSLPAGMRVVEPGDPFEDVRRVFDNVRICLAILSSLSLALCGVLIYNAVGVSVHQRRPQIGVLRTMGVGRGAIFRTFLLEGTMLGTVGAVYGLIVTVAAAPLVSRWFTVQLDVGTLLAIAAAGVVMAIGASIVPAYRASAEPPALAVRGPERQPSPRARRASIVTATAAAGAAAAAAFVALLHPGVGIATGTVTAVLVAALAALPLGVRTATSRLRAAT